MKNDLTCGVVRDLLPSYVEGLVGEESREAVDRHLAGCPDCTARKEAMSAPAEAAETAKEVDFLKKVKKRGAKRIVLAVVCTALVLVGALLAKEFVIGQTPDPERISIELAEADFQQTTLTFLADTYGGAYELRGIKSTLKDGVLTYTAREVRVNLFQELFMQETRGGLTGYWKQVPVEASIKDVKEVWFCGKLVWQDGMVITQECLDLLELRTPYCGDASALGKIAQALNLGERIGNYTMKIKTKSEPYRWTLNFDNTVSQNQSDYMTRCEYLMLALVDNLDSVKFVPQPTEISGVDIREDGTEVPWTQTYLGGEMVLTSADRGVGHLTEAYNKTHGTFWKAKTSVKDYTRTPADFQRLLAIVDYYFLEGGLYAG